MSIFKKETTQLIGISLLVGESLHFVVVKVQANGNAQLLTRKEFLVMKLTAAERKHEMHLLLSGVGAKNVQYRHLMVRDRAFTKQFQFPSRNMAEIKQMLKLRLPREIPSAIDEIVYHFHQIKMESKIANIQTTVLLFGVSKDAVNHEYDILRSFGVMPDHIILTTVALSGYLRKSKDSAHHLPALFLFGNNGKGEALLYDAQGIQMSRTFSYDLTDLAHSTNETIRPILDSLDQGGNESSFSIYLGGELYKTEADWLVTRHTVHALPEAEMNPKPMDFLFMAGAETPEEECEEFNLLPEDIKGRLYVANVQKSWAALRVSIVAFAFSIFLVSLFFSLRALLGISYLNRQISILDPDVREVKEISRKVKFLNRLRLDKIRPIDVFVRIHEEAGSEIQLNELDYNSEEKNVRLKGVSSSQTAVDRYVKELSGITWFSKVELQYSESSRDAKDLQFQFAVRASLKSFD